MKQLFKLRPGNKLIVIGGTAGMRELAEKDPEKVNNSKQIEYGINRLTAHTSALEMTQVLNVLITDNLF